MVLSPRQPPPKVVNLKTLATHCIYATLLASNPIQSLQTKSRTKADGTLVTDADGAAQRIIYNEIRRLNSGIRVVGEESDVEMNTPSPGETETERERASQSETDGNENENGTEWNVTLCNQDTHSDHDPSSSSTSTSTHLNAPLDDEHDETLLQDVQFELAKHDLPFPSSHETRCVYPNRGPIPDAFFSRPRTLPDRSEDIMDVSRVSVFVDPLDGTSAYAKGNYEAVTILVAIIVDNVPVFGLIVKPFKIGTDLHCFKDTKCSVLYGGTLFGGAYVMGGRELDRSREWRRSTQESAGMAVGESSAHFWMTYPLDPTTMTNRNLRERNNANSHSPISSLNIPHVQSTSTGSSQSEESPTATEGGHALTHADRMPRAIISKSRRGGVVQKCIESLSSLHYIHPEPIFVTGAGYKTMKLLIGEENETLWFFPKPGTSLWDVAAADALLRVMGGRISDKYGKDLDYSKGRLEADNMDGIIACSDAVLHAKCLELYKRESWDD